MKNIYYTFIVAFVLLFSCSESPFSVSPDNASSISKGGSTAKFAIKGDFLYTVENESLRVFDISNEDETLLLKKLDVNWKIETIFPYGNLLFLGTQSGVMIYDISAPSRPRYISDYAHIVSCDPVVTDGNYAYVTLRTGTNCGRPINELHILNLTDIANPVLINSISMTNPRGLAINNDILYVCDDGVKVLDVSDKKHIIAIDHIKNIPANDIIFYRNQLLVIADDGFYQFDANDLTQISFYSL